MDPTHGDPTTASGYRETGPGERTLRIMGGVVAATGVSGALGAGVARAASGAATSKVAELATPDGQTVRVRAPQGERLEEIAAGPLEARRATDNYPGLRLPNADGRWTGAPGNSGWVSDLPEVRRVTGDQPVTYREGYPDFSPWSRAEVKLSNMRGERGDFRAADELYAQQRGWTKPNGEADIGRARRFREDENLTWHHVEDGETMQLVPGGLNNKLPHTGGASLSRRTQPEGTK